jgi:hypothetical protein
VHLVAFGVDVCFLGCFEHDGCAFDAFAFLVDFADEGDGFLSVQGGSSGVMLGLGYYCWLLTVYCSNWRSRLISFVLLLWLSFNSIERVVNAVGRLGFIVFRVQRGKVITAQR